MGTSSSENAADIRMPRAAFPIATSEAPVVIMMLVRA